MEQDIIARAEAVASIELSSMDRRLMHVRAVAAMAATTVRKLGVPKGDAIVAAAWLHDIGYSPQLVNSGFHPLDGAAFVAAGGFPELVVSLVAYHSGAAEEALERGLSKQLDQYIQPPQEMLDLVTFADMTIDPDGHPTTVEARIVEILDRYSPRDPVHRAVTLSAPELRGAVQRTQQRLARNSNHPK